MRNNHDNHNMPVKAKNLQQSIIKILNKRADIYGFAYLEDIVLKFQKLKYAISIAVKLSNSIVDGIVDNLSPTQEYCEEYRNTNLMLDKIASNIENKIKKSGYNALAIPASKKTGFALRGEFPHKTAATRAGLGWIGKNSLLITRKYGPRIRLVTVLTDLPLKAAKPIKKSYCGKCTKCIDACPAGAIIGEKWYPGLDRERLIDVFRCDKWKKRNYYAICEGHICGICMAICPFGKSEKPKK